MNHASRRMGGMCLRFYVIGAMVSGGMLLSGCNRTPATSNTRAGDVDGWEIYTANCVACHRPDGKGIPNAFPPLAASEWVNGPARRLIALTLDGVKDTQIVNGQEYRGVMPAWRATLNDAQLAAVLTYIRQTWDNHSTSISPIDVQQVRTATFTHKTFWNTADLMGMSDNTPVDHSTAPNKP